MRGHRYTASKRNYHVGAGNFPAAIKTVAIKLRWIDGAAAKLIVTGIGTEYGREQNPARLPFGCGLSGSIVGESHGDTLGHCTTSFFASRFRSTPLRPLMPVP